MSRIGKIARRTFLVGSAVIAGGVAFGVYSVRKPYANPLEGALADGEATFNPWVKISPEKITLITPHADLGQGVVHMQATLIAEELDLDYGQFETEFGAPDAAYYNTAMASEAAPAVSAVSGMPQGMLNVALGSVFKLIGLQGTGGSSSVPDSFLKLREAGAVARETLKAAASQETGVPVAELKTQSGHVILPDGREIAYTALAATAATLEPVTDIALRDPSAWRLIGKPTERMDIVAKSTGTLSYGIDLEMDGMVHAAVRTNPRRAGVVSYDTTAAEGLRGVQGFVEVTNGVAALADNTWRAFQAANAVDVEWEPAAYPAEQDGHWAALEAAYDDAEIEPTAWRNDGDAEALSPALEAEYRAPYVAHQPLEPLNAIVRVTDDGVEVWTGHQMPRFLQQVVAGVTGHEAEQVTFHNQYAGGSFGHRLEFEHIKLATEIANQMRGTPVKLTYTREEDFAQDFPRHIAMARGRGAVADGQVKGVDIAVAAPSVINSQMGRIGMGGMGPDSQLSAGIFNAPYGLETFRVTTREVPGLAPTSSWRSVGASWGGFFIETLMDELIHEAGADPVEERLRLITDPVARGVLEAAADMASWGGELAPGKGRGVALVESFGVPVAEIVEVAETEDGIRLDTVWVAADAGTVVDPVNMENHIQGGVIWGLGHAMNSEITYSDGMAEQANYYDAEGMRLYQTPEIVVKTLTASPAIKGIGEPPVPPAPPALANAIFAATGTRLREMPFNRFVDFV